MATIRAYSDLEQSRKLAEILPLESADMHYFNYGNITKPFIGFDVNQTRPQKNNEVYEYIPCWSLAALLYILPFPQLSKDKLGSGKVGWMVSVYPDNCRYDSCWHDNPVDACVDMIEKLHEHKMLLL